MRPRWQHAEEAPAADVRPTLLGVVTLLFLLLFFLLATSSGQRLGVIALKMGGASDLAPLPHSGVVKRVDVTVSTNGAMVTADVQTTDIAAAATSVEHRTIAIGGTGSGPNLVLLDSTLAALKSLDPAQERATVHPDPDVPTETLLHVLDVTRGPRASPRFPKLALAVAEP